MPWRSKPTQKETKAIDREIPTCQFSIFLARSHEGHQDFGKIRDLQVFQVVRHEGCVADEKLNNAVGRFFQRTSQLFASELRQVVPTFQNAGRSDLRPRPLCFVSIPRVGVHFSGSAIEVGRRRNSVVLRHGYTQTSVPSIGHSLPITAGTGQTPSLQFTRLEGSRESDDNDSDNYETEGCWFEPSGVY